MVKKHYLLIIALHQTAEALLLYIPGQLQTQLTTIFSEVQLPMDQAALPLLNGHTGLHTIKTF